MARELILSLNKKSSTFAISKVDRKKLYGYKKRAYLDEKGNECLRANLEEETGIVFESGDFNSCYLDNKGNFIETKNKSTCLRACKTVPDVKIQMFNDIYYSIIYICIK